MVKKLLTSAPTHIQQAFWDHIANVRGQHRTTRIPFWTTATFILIVPGTLFVSSLYILHASRHQDALRLLAQINLLVVVTWTATAFTSILIRRLRDIGIHPFWAVGLLIATLTTFLTAVEAELPILPLVPILITFLLCALPSKNAPRPKTNILRFLAQTLGETFATNSVEPKGETNVPQFWISILAIYLLTFILSFSSNILALFATEPLLDFIRVVFVTIIAFYLFIVQLTLSIRRARNSPLPTFLAPVLFVAYNLFIITGAVIAGPYGALAAVMIGFPIFGIPYLVCCSIPKKKGETTP